MFSQKFLKIFRIPFLQRTFRKVSMLLFSEKRNSNSQVILQNISKIIATSNFCQKKYAQVFYKKLRCHTLYPSFNVRSFYLFWGQNKKNTCFRANDGLVILRHNPPSYNFNFTFIIYIQSVLKSIMFAQPYFYFSDRTIDKSINQTI